MNKKNLVSLFISEGKLTEIRKNLQAIKILRPLYTHTKLVLGYDFLLTPRFTWSYS